MNQADIGHPGFPEIQPAEPGQRAEVGKSCIRDRRAGEAQGPQARQSLEVDQTVVRDRGAAKIERPQLDEISQVGQSSIGDSGIMEVKLPEIRRQTADSGKFDIGNLICSQVAIS